MHSRVPDVHCAPRNFRRARISREIADAGVYEKIPDAAALFESRASLVTPTSAKKERGCNLREREKKKRREKIERQRKCTREGKSTWQSRGYGDTVSVARERGLAGASRSGEKSDCTRVVSWATRATTYTRLHLREQRYSG